MANTTYNSIDDNFNNLQSLKFKTKFKFYENLSKYYDNMNLRMEEDLFAKNVQGVSKIYHEVLLLLKILQTKPQFEKLNKNYYNLYYTVIKNRDAKEILNDKNNNNENGYCILDDFILPNHIMSIKSRETILK